MEKLNVSPLPSGLKLLSSPFARVIGGSSVGENYAPTVPAPIAPNSALTALNSAPIAPTALDSTLNALHVRVNTLSADTASDKNETTKVTPNEHSQSNVVHHSRPIPLLSLSFTAPDDLNDRSGPYWRRITNDQKRWRTTILPLKEKDISRRKREIVSPASFAFIRHRRKNDASNHSLSRSPDLHKDTKHTESKSVHEISNSESLVHSNSMHSRQSCKKSNAIPSLPPLETVVTLEPTSDNGSSSKTRSHPVAKHDDDDETRALEMNL